MPYLIDLDNNYIITQGEGGDQGLQGEKGEDAILPIGVDVTIIFKGQQGMKGRKGGPGGEGADGNKGQSGDRVNLFNLKVKVAIFRVISILDFKLDSPIFDTIFREIRDIMEYQAEKESVEKLETEEKLVSPAVQVLSA